MFVEQTGVTQICTLYIIVMELPKLIKYDKT